MTTDENGYPIIRLTGSLDWETAYDLGNVLSKSFPGAGAHDLCIAMQYNGPGPVTATNGIADLVMTREGERDGRSWIWEVSMEDGTDWIAEGWCDYTGWDCQSGLNWSQRGT